MAGYREPVRVGCCRWNMVVTSFRFGLDAETAECHVVREDLLPVRVATIHFGGNTGEDTEQF